MNKKLIQTFPMRENVAAVSVGMKNGECLLDPLLRGGFLRGRGYECRHDGIRQDR